jgi:hypothetical protein
MHRMMKLNDMTEMDFDEENEQIEEEAESMLGTMVGPIPTIDHGRHFLDEDVSPPLADPAAGTPGGDTARPVLHLRLGLHRPRRLTIERSGQAELAKSEGSYTRARRSR